jgi:type II secretory pathway component PulM
MENNSRFGQFFSQLGDRISEQSWFQQSKAKWDELDPQARLIAGLGSAVGTVLLALILLIVAFFNVRAQKNELTEKQELVHLIQTANDELRSIRETGAGRLSGAGGESDAPWSPYLTSTAEGAGIEQAKIEVGAEKPSPSASGPAGTFHESLIDVSLKKVNIKQVVRYAVQLENGNRPIKLRNLTIDTQADQSGYLDATLALSAFSEKK